MNHSHNHDSMTQGCSFTFPCPNVAGGVISQTNVRFTIPGILPESLQLAGCWRPVRPGWAMSRLRYAYRHAFRPSLLKQLLDDEFFII